MPNPASNPTIALLLHVKDPSPFVEYKGEKLPAEINGQPVRHFWKECLPEGDYAGVKEQDTGLSLSVQQNRIDSLIDTMREMRAVGFKPFVPTRHKKYDANDNLGWLIDAKRAPASNRPGDSLYLLHQMIGDDAIKATARNDSSICVKRNFTDDKGRFWPEYIDHNALCPDSVLTGLKPFEPLEPFDPAIAASRDQATPAVVLELAAYRSDDMKLTPAQLANVQKLLPDKYKAIVKPEDMPDTLLDDLITLATPKPDVISLSRADKEKLDGQVTTLTAEVANLRAKGNTDPDPPPNERLMLSRIWESESAAIIDSGAIDKPTMTKLSERFGFATKNPTKFALSRASEKSDPEALELLTILKGNKPADAPEKGEREVIALSRRNVDGSKDKKELAQSGEAQGKAHADQRIAQMSQK